MGRIASLRGPIGAARAWYVRHAALLHLLGFTTATLVASWLWRRRCLDFAWHGRQYEIRCYNDIQPLYHGRGLKEGLLPYVEAFNEYPVVTGMFQHMVARLTDDVDGFYGLTALLLGTVAIGVTWMLMADRGARPRLLAWAVAPSLFLYAFHNWDLLAVGLSTAGLLLHRRGHAAATGAVMALAGMAKIYPLLFLPLLGIDLLRREGGLGRQGWRFGLAAVGTLAAVNLPFWLADPGLWWQTYTFHAGRTPNFESIWFVLRLSAEASGADALVPWVSGGAVDAAMLLALAGGLGWSAWMAARGRDVRLLCFALLLVFVVSNKVFSVQYAVWLVPFFALLDVPWRRMLAFFAADGLVFWTVWPIFQGTEDAIVPFSIAVVLRFAAMLALLAWAVRQARSGPHDSVPQPSVS